MNWLTEECVAGNEIPSQQRTASKVEFIHPPDPAGITQ
jgi:hypothetical protein